MGFLKPKKAKSSSESYNKNNDLIKSTYGGVMNSGVGATNFLSSLLTGSGDVGAANAGFQNYLQSAGFAPAMRQLSQNITGQGAASGLLNSGATAKALQSRGTELNQGFYNNYLQQLAGLSGLGLQAGGLVTSAGEYNKSKSTGGGPSTLGSIASTVGGIASIFSDRRLKRDIELIEREADGLGIYAARYLWSAKRYLMVMADEVAKLRPWALGPTKYGFATVNYGAL
jgi:hypothetical protein